MMNNHKQQTVVTGVASAEMIAGTRILRLPQVMKLTGLSRATIFRLEKKEQFAPRVKLSLRAVGWTQESVFAWIDSREHVK